MHLPGAVSDTFWAILGLFGMFISTKTHTEGGIDEIEADALEIDAQKEVESSPEEVVEKEIVWFYTYHKVSIEENGLECIDK